MDNILSKRKKPDAEALSDKLDSSISTDSPMLEQLQLMERQLDARIMRRMLAIQESIKAPNRVTRTLRLHVSNSYAHQEHQEADPEVVEPPCWTLKVSGYLLDDAGARAAATPATRFTQYLSKVAITLDEKLYPGSQALIEWIKNPSEPPTDSFEIKRQGNIDSVCRLSFFMDYAPEKFALPAILATALNMKVDTKAKILNAMFAYIKNRNLLDALNPTTLKCDDVLREVFQVTEFPIYELSNRLAARLSRPDPLTVSYRIRVSGDPTTLEDVYEIPIEVPAEPDFDLRKLVALHDELLKKIEKTNEDVRIICHVIDVG
jgi:SWI/SNF-related matrix-associated actin-dependent regulator of chromatin subfamily D